MYNVFYTNDELKTKRCKVKEVELKNEIKKLLLWKINDIPNKLEQQKSEKLMELTQTKHNQLASIHILTFLKIYSQCFLSVFQSENLKFH